MKNQTFRLSDELIKLLNELSKKYDISPADYIRCAIKYWKPGAEDFKNLPPRKYIARKGVTR